jgi:predicted transcriptional regulator
MQTHTAERQELHKTIDALPNESVIAILDLIRSLRNDIEIHYSDGYLPHIPNEETLAAMAELRAGKGETVTMEELKAMLDEIE